MPPASRTPKRRVVPTAKEVNPSEVNTNSLDGLLNEDGRELLDIVDLLRAHGLSGELQLPQLVVCGDQSSGKSSVLEAITEIPFPRKEGLCTRFANEIILRRSQSSSISVKITPHDSHSANEQAALESFQRKIDNFQDLPELLEESAQLMGLGGPESSKSKSFSKDVLSITVEGPNRPHLTVVDLPGIIHVSTGTEDNKALIFDLVREYMKNPRAIVLAVIAGSNDPNNQIILHEIKECGAQDRALGIITKPDMISDTNMENWLDLFHNKEVVLGQGWHMLRNRTPKETKLDFEQRRTAEKYFFSMGKFATLPRERVGIDTLRECLSNLLLRHLRKELPSLRDEVIMSLGETKEDLEKIGEKRSGVVEQRQTLMKITEKLQDIVKSASKGQYDNAEFFGSIDMTVNVCSKKNIRRFRAVVQQLNLDFSKKMQLQGHKYTIGNSTWDGDIDMEDEDNENDEPSLTDTPDLDTYLPTPKIFKGKEALKWVQDYLQRSRGTELLGSCSQQLITQLFREQSSHWQELAEDHIRKVNKACKSFLKDVLDHVAPSGIGEILMAQTVAKALEDAVKSSRDELKKLMSDKNEPLTTYNCYYASTLRKQRQRKHARHTREAIKLTSTICYQGTSQKHIDATKLEKAMRDSVETNLDKASSEEALTMMCAYYKHELPTFVDLVAKQVIERHLVRPLPDIILSPTIVLNMSDDDVKKIAAESPATAKRRFALEKRKSMLEKGLDAFRDAMDDWD